MNHERLKTDFITNSTFYEKSSESFKHFISLCIKIIGNKNQSRHENKD